MARLRHHESQTPDGCDLKDVHERVDVIFLNQVQVLNLHLFLLNELLDDFDQLLTAFLFLPEPLFDF